MRFAVESTLIATACLASIAHALPRPIPTYSVVNVDGGSEVPPSLPTTIYQTVTQSSGSETTISVTDVVSLPTTVVSIKHGKATETALIPEVSVLPDHPHHEPESSSTVKESIVTIISVTTATPITPTTTSYYDNGKWHTSYAIKDFAGQWRPSATHDASAYGTGAAHVARSWPTGYRAAHPYGTGAAHVARSWPTGYKVAYPYYPGAAHTGRSLPTGYSVVGWNATQDC